MSAQRRLKELVAVSATKFFYPKDGALIGKQYRCGSCCVLLSLPYPPSKGDEVTITWRDNIAPQVPPPREEMSIAIAALWADARGAMNETDRIEKLQKKRSLL